MRALFIIAMILLSFSCISQETQQVTIPASAIQVNDTTKRTSGYRIDTTCIYYNYVRKRNE